MVAQVENRASLDLVQKTKTLICALNLISRNLPLPPEVFDTVCSIYLNEDDSDNSTEHGITVEAHNSDGNRLSEDDSSGHQIFDGGALITEFEEALVKQRPNCMSGLKLRESKESRLQSHIQHRLTELEEFPSSRGEILQTKCLLELYGLKLAELQSKVRTDVNLEYWLREKCAYPEKQLFDWGMMRLCRPFIMYGVADAFAMETDERLRKKRDAERFSRVEEEEKNLMETQKRKFFADLLNTAREFQLQAQAALKRRKQRNDGVQAWHGRQRQRATRAEKLRFQALKADDQEAYMRLVEESKNERLTTLLGKTNELLVRLGAAVQRQKDAEHSDGKESLKGSVTDNPLHLSASESKTPGDLLPDEDIDLIDLDSDHHVKTSDLLEGQRQYNSVIHSIQEKVKNKSLLFCLLYLLRLLVMLDLCVSCI
ncbi:probable ATP-dependent DNA helicase CHR12 [Telopea speciosissima]|uniref:probable ATP-dependent DNA helicase CHR12 n=1 Tax=Telopea speciosissima TaxID=54955 RepID=UPI001CC63877|nr:probable ATP-dependent DNA helicase CHR12 [Telopea speciosissima]